MKCQILFPGKSTKNISCRLLKMLPKVLRVKMCSVSCANMLWQLSLRKQAYSNILKILPTKNENFQIKIQIFFLFLLKT